MSFKEFYLNEGIENSDLESIFFYVRKHNLRDSTKKKIVDSLNRRTNDRNKEYIGKILQLLNTKKEKESKDYPVPETFGVPDYVLSGINLFQITKNISAWERTGSKPSNHYYGSAQLFRPTYQKINIKKGTYVEINYSTITLQTNGNKKIKFNDPNKDWSPFEKHYGGTYVYLPKDSLKFIRSMNKNELSQKEFDKYFKEEN